jgi:hypothetical protein
MVGGRATAGLIEFFVNMVKCGRHSNMVAAVVLAICQVIIGRSEHWDQVLQTWQTSQPSNSTTDYTDMKLWTRKPMDHLCKVDF